jgi:hypothetical protein
MASWAGTACALQRESVELRLILYTLERQVACASDGMADVSVIYTLFAFAGPERGGLLESQTAMAVVADRGFRLLIYLRRWCLSTATEQTFALVPHHLAGSCSQCQSRCSACRLVKHSNPTLPGQTFGLIVGVLVVPAIIYLNFVCSGLRAVVPFQSHLVRPVPPGALYFSGMACCASAVVCVVRALLCHHHSWCCRDMALGWRHRGALFTIYRCRTSWFCFAVAESWHDSVITAGDRQNAAKSMQTSAVPAAPWTIRPFQDESYCRQMLVSTFAYVYV